MDEEEELLYGDISSLLDMARKERCGVAAGGSGVFH